MGITALAILLACLSLASAARIQPKIAAAAHKPPVWPAKYTAKYTLSLPHLYLTQPNGLQYPVQVWYDANANKQRVDTYGGIDSTLTLGASEYTVFPRLDSKYCSAFVPGPVASPDGTLQKAAAPDPLLPDLSTWDFAGEVHLDGVKDIVHMWQTQLKQGDKVSQYAFYVTSAGVPLKFHMFGVNYLTDSHFDEYIYHIHSFETKFEDNGIFDLPAICKDDAEGVTMVRVTYRHPVALQHAAVLPDTGRKPYDHNRAYHIWAKAHDRVHSSQEEVEERLARFTSVADRIRTHNVDAKARAAGTNPRGPSFTMRMNRFADWSDEDFVSTMMPKKLRDKAAAADGKIKDAYKPLSHFKSKKSKSELPRSVDWRGTGADPGMKDQATCGSCFAFAATAAMEGSWYMATGEHRSFSEQQVIDCSWEWGPNGCAGGDYQPVFNYVANSGGISLEQEYPYQGQNDYCRNRTRVGQFDGFIEVESRDEVSLMEAVHKFGPIAVAVDAAAESFRYYSEGVYYQSDCRTKGSDLDHAVVLFGYGTTDDGEDYWLVRNTWAKFYGDDGYLKMPRGRHDCGISTDPAVAVVNKKYEVQGRREIAMLEATRARRG